MSLKLLNSFHQPQIPDLAGMCFRLAIKWAVTEACGSEQPMFLTDEQWSQMQSQKPSPKQPHQRWEKTAQAQRAYANAIASAETIRFNASYVDWYYIAMWTIRLLQKHQPRARFKVEKLQLQELRLANSHALTNDDSEWDALLLCCILAASGGGHTLAIANGNLFDPNTGTWSSAEQLATTAEFMGYVDQYIQGRYRNVIDIDCYLITIAQ